MSSAFLEKRWPQKMIGILSGIAVAGYAVVIAVQGGFYNSNRPHDFYDVQKAKEKYEISRQSADSLFSEAIKLPGKRNKNLERAFVAGLELVRKRFEFHRQIAYNKRPVPKDFSTDLAAFLNNDLPQFPDEFRLRTDQVADRTILFATQYHYEILGGSTETGEVIYREFLTQLVQKQWKVEELVFDQLSSKGLISAERGKWHFVLGVYPEETFPGLPVTVLWRMDRTDSSMDLDEDSYGFYSILSVYQYYWD